MRTMLCALALASALLAGAQSRAPLHHAGKVVKNRYHAVGHKARAVRHYVGHKVRGVRKAMEN